ncbi:MAG: hypothetical protein ACLRQA_07065 [Anaerovoracaceae bacterium]
MKRRSKNMIWYLGYAASLALILIIILTDLPGKADMALAVLMAVIFSVSHMNIFHNKMLSRDDDYRVSVMDERNIAIREKAGNIANMATMTLLGLATVIFIAFDYIFSAIVTGVIVAVQPVILIIISNALEKRM